MAKRKIKAKKITKILLIIIFIVTWLTNGFEDDNENRGAVL